MKYKKFLELRIYESLNKNKPKIGDYVIAEDDSSREDIESNINKILCTQIGQIISIRDSKFVYVKYEKHILDHLSVLDPGNARENCMVFYFTEIKYWSKNKEDLQQIIDANKFGL